MMMSVASISETARRASTGTPLASATLPRSVATISIVNGGSSGIDGSRAAEHAERAQHVVDAGQCRYDRIGNGHEADVQRPRLSRHVKASWHE